jgi:hypothetical protein
MKGFSMKRLAAIGLGAALVGSALAPVVSAATVKDNVSSIVKGDIISTAGAPVVDVVVGVNAAASDVVWAGNIAARVAQLATTDGSCASGEAAGKSVSVTVGGTSVVSGGARELSNANLNSTIGTAEYTESIGNTYFKSFANTTKNATRDGNSTFSINVLETVGVTLDARMNVTSQNVKDLVADVDPNDVNYVMTINPGITLNFQDNGTGDYIPVSFMGKSYVIDSATASSVVLVSDNAEQLYKAGDVISNVQGRDGLMYSLKFTGGYDTGSANVATIELDDANGIKLQEQSFNANSDIVFRNNQGQEILSTKVRLKTIGTTTSADSTVFNFTALVGTDRVEIRNGREVPYDPNSTGSSMPWVATINTSGSTLTGITLKNNTYYKNNDTPLYSEEYSFYPTEKATSFNLFEGTGLDSIGSVKFKGFYDVGAQKTGVSYKKGTSVASETTAISYGAINYTDVSGQAHSIPMAISLNSTSGTNSGQTFKFEGIDVAYATNGTTSPTDLLIRINSLDTNLLNGFNPSLNASDQNIVISGADVNYDTPITLTGKNEKTYKYLAKRGTNNGVFLVLQGKDSADAVASTGKIDDLQYSAGSLFFLGTALNDANTNMSWVGDYNSDLKGPSVTGVPYYLPDMYDFNGVQSGSSTGIYRTAVFEFTEGVQATWQVATTAASGLVYVDTEGGNSGTVDTANIAKLNYNGQTTAVEYYGANQNLTTLSEYLGNPGESSANYKKAYSDYGTKLVLDGRELTVTIPDRQMKSYFSVESNSVQTTQSGGTSFTDLADQSTQTKDGVTVTVDAIAGSCGAGGTAVIISPITGQLVVTDAKSSATKSIIVGGQMVNSAAASAVVDGQSLSDLLVSSGDKVSYVSEVTGDIIVAGYTADDTASAAQALISQLENILNE